MNMISIRIIEYGQPKKKLKENCCFFILCNKIFIILHLVHCQITSNVSPDKLNDNKNNNDTRKKITIKKCPLAKHKSESCIEILVAKDIQSFILILLIDYVALTNIFV